jgi:hypothetical protein
MLVDCNRHPGQPIPLLHQIDEFCGSEEFDSVLWWIAQGLEQLGRDQDWHVVGLAAEQPGDLINGEPGWRLPNQCQKLMLHFLHNATLSSEGGHARPSANHADQVRTDLIPPAPWDP